MYFVKKTFQVKIEREALKLAMQYVHTTYVSCPDYDIDHRELKLDGAVGHLAEPP